MMDYIQKAILYIEDNIAADINLVDCADAASMSLMQPLKKCMRRMGFNIWRCI